MGVLPMNHFDERPDPDELLHQIKQSEISESRGKLKIFFGYAAGVGKTYTMLEDAHTAKKAGIDVVVGYIEPHTRPETLARLKGLEILPTLEVSYKGITLKEFDLDGALARKPDLILVDELAHTNADGMRHLKRYSDIEELLEAGIDVYTTVNVQHIESLNDIVASFTNVVVQERVPDYIFNQASQVELIDIEPNELIQRLNEGKIYKATQAQKALSNFFTNENLVALREISLRHTADRVNKELETSKINKSNTRYMINEHILVCLSSSSSNSKIIRTAARMANAFHASFTAIYVETPKMKSFSESRKKSLRDNIKLAEELGAKITTTYSDDIANQIAEFARVSGISKIVVGRSKRRTFLRSYKSNIVDQLIYLAPELEIFVIPDELKGMKDEKLFEQRFEFSFKDTLKMLGIMSVATAIGLAIHILGISESNVIIIYILAVLITANHTTGRLYSGIASFVGVLCFNFFFTEPRFTLNAYSAEYPITFAIMLTASFITSTLASRSKSQANASAINAYRTNILLDTNNHLQNANSLEEIIIEAERQVYKILKKPIVLYTAKNGQISSIYSYESEEGEPVDEMFFDKDEQAVVTWVLKNKKRAGIGTETLPGSKACYLPIIGQEGVLAVVGVILKTGEQIENHERSLLAALLGQIAFALDNYNINDMKNQAAMQAESERFRANLLRAVSHDLRTPLTSISGSASSLLTNHFDEATRITLTQGIYDDSIWLINLVENLLSVSRIGKDGVNLKLEPQLIEEVITEALAHVSRNASEHNITVDVRNKLLMVHVDLTLIIQVFINLIDNAIKYTAAGSNIKIVAIQRGKEVLIKIADNGSGISDKDKECIFDMFFTASGNSGDNRRGLGLGLALCKSIIDAHGGEIYVKDNKPIGTVFEFTLPLAEVKNNENFNINR